MTLQICTPQERKTIEIFICIMLALSDDANVDCQISFLSPHPESHGLLFKFLIQIRSLSTDRAI